MEFPGPQGPRAYLKTENGHRVELLPNRMYVLGRDETCDVRLDDAGCSRRHARVSVSGDGKVVYLYDLDSKNGTYLNGVLIDDRVQLKDGDFVRIGSSMFQVSIWRGGVEMEFETRTIS